MAKKGPKQHGIDVSMSEDFTTLTITGWRLGTVTDEQGNAVTGKKPVGSVVISESEIHPDLRPRFLLEGVNKFLQQRTSQFSEEVETRMEEMGELVVMAREGKYYAPSTAGGSGGGYVPNLMQIRATEAALGISMDEAEAALRGLTKEQRATWFADERYKGAYDGLKAARGEAAEPATNAIAAALPAAPAAE